MSEQGIDQSENLIAPAPCRNGPLERAAVEHRADAISAPREQPGERRHEVDQDSALDPLRFHAAEIDRRTQVQQEPGRDLAVLDVLADVWRIHASGDVPIDRSHVVAGLILANVHEIHAVAAEEAPVVALEDAVEAADDLPFEALEDLLGGRRGAPEKILQRLEWKVI